MNPVKRSLLNRHPALLLLFLLLAISGVIYWDFLSLTNFFLFKDIGSDTLNVFYPKYVQLADYIRSDGWPAWSFSQGMGQNIFPASIGQPFQFALMLMGSDTLAYGLVYVQLSQILLAGLLFYLYLRCLSFLPITAVLGALLYAFSGFMILGGTWYVFSVDAVYFAFLLFAFERYLTDKQWFYFPLAVALVAAGISFNLYVFALFFLPYSLLRFYVCHGWQVKPLMHFLFKLAGFATLGIGISAVFLIANAQQMLNSPRVLGDASFFASLMNTSLFEFEGFSHNFTAIMRLFSNDLLGTGSDYNGWRNYLEAPLFYCGLLSLLLAPQVFVQLDRKYRLAYALFGLVFLLPVVMPYFRYLFWAFSGDYYRLYSAFVTFVILFYSLYSLNHILKAGKLHTGLLLTSLVLLLMMLFSPWLLADIKLAGLVDTRLALTATGFMLVYTALLVALKSDRFRSYAQWGLLLIVCVEMAVFSWPAVNDRPLVSVAEFNSKTGYNDYTNEAVAALKEKDPGFYRIEKTYASGPSKHPSINDAQIQGYFGTTAYQSFNQLNYIRFLDALDVIDGSKEEKTRWAAGILNNPFLTSFASVKYVFVKNKKLLQGFAQRGYRVVHQEGDVFILLNPSFLPFGFTYDSFMDQSEFLALPKQLKSIALLKTAVSSRQIDDSGSEPIMRFNPKDIEQRYDAKAFRHDIDQRRKDVLKISSFYNNHVVGEIDLARPGILFFTIPFDRGWSAAVNGKPAELLKLNIGFSGLLLPAGKHDIELHYQLPFFKTSLLISFLSILVLLLFAWRRTDK